ncbi:unnamed protein product [Peniophora sp. CBMAI 1063]|nr:unnamed protein product [Peniophora sp. CBMAI 1063]
MGRTNARKRDAITADLSDSENVNAKNPRATRASVKKFLDLEAVEAEDDDGSAESGLFNDSDSDSDGDDCDVPLVVAGKEATAPGDPPVAPSAVTGSNVNELDIFGEANQTAPAPTTPPSNPSSAVEKPETPANKGKDKAPAVQTNLDNTVVAKNKMPDVAPEDAVPPRASFTKAVLKRFDNIFTYKYEDESTFYLRTKPADLVWSSSRVKGSYLRVKDDVPPIKFWSLGDINWNGLLPENGSYPNKAKLSITPLREGDLMHIRKLIGTHSKTKKPLETEKISHISAHKDMSARARGVDAAESKPFAYIYDGRQIFTPDKTDMRTLAPNTLVRGDVVLMEFTVARYWDESENGRVKNWDSSRVFFQLEAVTLLVNAEEQAEITVNASKPKKKVVI